MCGGVDEQPLPKCGATLPDRAECDADSARGNPGAAIGNRSARSPKSWDWQLGKPAEAAGAARADRRHTLDGKKNSAERGHLSLRGIVFCPRTGGRDSEAIGLEDSQQQSAV
jgi:hypothetical protein